MARRVSTTHKLVTTVAAWIVGFVIFFPILWMMLASFKTELEAFAIPPSFLFFHWTTENYAAVQERSDYLHHAINSIVIAGGSTLIALLIAIPAARSMAIAAPIPLVPPVTKARFPVSFIPITPKCMSICRCRRF